MIAGRDALCDGEVVVLALAGRLAAAGRHQIEQLGLHLPRSGRPARSGGAGAGVAQSLMSLMRLMSSRSPDEPEPLAALGSLCAPRAPARGPCWV